MPIIGALVVYAISFFVVLLLVLPRGQQTQDEAGEIVPGTPPGAPSTIRIHRKFLYAALIAIAPTILALGAMEYGWLSLDDFDFLFPNSFKNRVE